jgi:sulfur carrier protein ThiS
MLCQSAPEKSVAKVVLASALARWLPQSAASEGGEVSLDIPGSTVADTLEHLFALHPVLRGYVVDERGALRRHVALFVDGNAIHHNSNLQQALGEHADVHVMQALSGG